MKTFRDVMDNWGTEPNFRVAIGTKVQHCHCCDSNLKKEPFIRMDYVARSWGGANASVNVCFRCIKLQNKELNKALRNKKISEDMFLHKLNEQ
jgi:hypothetical protein